MKRLILLALAAAGVAAAPWHMALLAVAAIVVVLALVAWRGRGGRRGTAVFLAILAVAALTAGRDAFDASHFGAPVWAWTASYHCPPGDTLYTNDWEKAARPARAARPRAAAAAPSMEADAIAARKAYRKSVRDGAPLSDRALGRKYEQTRDWGARRISEVKSAPLADAGIAGGGG